MKRVIWSISVLSFMFLLANCADKDSKRFVEIPDVNFKLYLLESFDTNKDGKISMSEAKTVIEIDCSYRNIETLEGIEKFENMERLICNNNNLRELELRYNKKLNWLDCTNNNDPLMIYLGLSSLLKNSNFVRPQDGTPTEPLWINPIDVSKCMYDDGKAQFVINFDY